MSANAELLKFLLLNLIPVGHKQRTEVYAAGIEMELKA